MTEGVFLELNKDSGVLELSIDPIQVKAKLTVKKVLSDIRGLYPELVVFEDAVNELVSAFQSLGDPSTSEVIKAEVGEARDAEIQLKISDDELTAHAIVEAARGGKNVSADDILAAARRQNISRGLSKKRCALLAEQVAAGQAGQVFEELIAKGLPARNGKNTKQVPLFESMEDKLRKPKKLESGKVDMRDLGEIFSVKPGTPVMRFSPPTDGRAGYTITNKPIMPVAGEWGKKQCGKGTRFSDDDDNLVVADIDGIPKFENDVVTVEDVFTSKGCNISTGNIKYEGDVLINGDVTEGMSVEASGNVTVNGYVESATIISGGSITITQGASGKMSEDLSDSTTHIKATGNIHIQQGRGLIIRSQKGVSIGKQLAFSNIECNGDVVTGQADKPSGNIYASEIKTLGKVRVGKLGAVSGSKVLIDFSAGRNKLLSRKEQLNKLKAELDESLTKHRQTLEIAKNKRLSKALQEQVQELRKLYRKQSNALKVIEKKLERVVTLLEGYENAIGVETYQKLFHGVQVRLNKRTWEAVDDHNRARILYREGKWQYEPMV